MEQQQANQIFDDILSSTVMSTTLNYSDKIKIIEALWQLIKNSNLQIEFENYLQEQQQSKSQYTLEGIKLILEFKQ
ncbi:MAG: hypothetical protein PHS07_00650 [Patescibacteria group bacterium]|nr:hypothetical protein [Patescibacteria group bacterium]